MLHRAYRNLRRRLSGALLEHHRRSILRLARGGEGLHLDGRILLVHGDRLTLGSNVHIGHDASFNCLGGVTIGDQTIISGRVTIYSYDHNFRDARRLPFDDDVIPRPVHIGRYVWIGMNSTIAPGAVIGDGAVIGIGTVVSGEIPPRAIVVGAKPRIVGYRDPDQTRDLDEQQRYFFAA